MARGNIHGRLERLESKARPRTCPVCGMRPDAGARTVVGWDRVVLCELVED